MGAYAGKSGLVYLSISGTDVPALVLRLNDWTLNRTTDKIEVTSFLDKNKTYVQGLPDLKGTFKGFWDPDESKPFAASKSVDGCQIVLYPSADAPSKFAYGPAWLDVNIDTPVGGAVAMDASFAANGSWSDTF
jgi:hypothetical protein